MLISIRLKRQHAFLHKEGRELETKYGTNKNLLSAYSQVNKSSG
jgi:hypothetical protein